MPSYSATIETRADVIRFFVYLREELDLDFHPDDRFDDFPSIGQSEQKVSQEDRKKLDQIMLTCQKWCDQHGEDMYRMATKAQRFAEFLTGHVRLTDREEMVKFAREFIDANYELGGNSLAIHTYGGCYYIEEFMHEGRPHFQCIIENTNPWSDNLREIEVELYDWAEPNEVRRMSRRR